MLKAVIFDFDGVITDSETLHLRAFNETLETFGFKIETTDYYQKYLGLTDKDCFKTLIQEGRLALDENQVPELISRKKLIYGALAASEGHVIAGVRPFLALLDRHHITRAICSGALEAEIRFTLKQAGLEDGFAVIVAADHVTTGKPNPEGYLLTLQRLQAVVPDLRADHCVVIEDARWGLDAANVAGMHTLAVTNSYPADQLGGAEKIVGSLDEVTLETLTTLCA